MKIKTQAYIFIFFLIFSFILPSKALASKSRLFQTKYTRVHYVEERSLKNFIWRISGKKITLPVDFSLAKNSIDRITERVQSILDMHPSNFKIDIFLYPKYKSGSIALYNKKIKTITVYADKITDGVLAHELAHAIINSYFETPPPRKIQEILTNYVDRHLWSDY